MRGVALIAVMLFLYLCTQTRSVSEGYELFAGAGFKRTPPFKSDLVDPGALGEESQVTDATPDLIQRLVTLVVNSNRGECLYPIETNSLTKFGDSQTYRTSFTFVRPDTGFPTGVVVQSIVDLGTNRVFGSKTQVVERPANITSYQPGMTAAFSGVRESSLPTRDALDGIKN